MTTQNEALQLVPSQWRQVFLNFLETGDAPEDFLAFLEEDEQTKRACEIMLRADHQTKTIIDAAMEPSNEVEEEMRSNIDLVLFVLNSLGLTDYRVRVGLRDPDSDKYVGGDEVWNNAERNLLDIVKASGMNYTAEPGEAAFYGPKIDFVVKKKKYQVRTAGVWDDVTKAAVEPSSGWLAWEIHEDDGHGGKDITTGLSAPENWREKPANKT